MNLRERLLADLQDAMRNRDERRKAAIRMVRSCVSNAEIDAHRDLSDAEIQDVIAKEVKRRQEALDLFRQANRSDLAAKEEIELAVLNSYLPKQLAREKIEQVVRRIVTDSGAGSSGSFNYAGYPSFPSDEEMDSYVSAAKALSLYEIPVEVQSTDRLLTLSTVGDPRGETLVLMARKLRQGETATSHLLTLQSLRAR